MTWTHHHAHPAVRRDVDMTQGSITRHLVEFALPLLAGAGRRYSTGLICGGWIVT